MHRDTDAPLKIGEAARVLGTTERTIRYYEEQGLIRPLRSGKGTRRYAAQHIAALRSALQLAGNGLSIDTLHQLAGLRETCDTGAQSARHVGRLLDEQIQTIEARIGALKTLRKQLQAARGVINKCAHCRNKAGTETCPECPVVKARERHDLLCLIWDQEPAPKA